MPGGCGGGGISSRLGPAFIHTLRVPRGDSGVCSVDYWRISSLDQRTGRTGVPVRLRVFTLSRRYQDYQDDIKTISRLGQNGVFLR